MSRSCLLALAIMVALPACEKLLLEGDRLRETLPSGRTVEAPQPSAYEDATPAELVELAKTSTGKVAHAAIRKLAMQRTDAACALIIQILRNKADRLEGPVPSIERAKLIEAEYFKSGKAPAGYEQDARYLLEARTALDAAQHLVLLDLPEGRKAAADFRKAVEKKWAGSATGELLLDTMNREHRQAEEAVKIGYVPWKMQK